MPILPRISSSEWEVMNVLWDRHPLTASDVLTALSTQWAQKTVNTFLARLVEKQALRVEKQNGINHYIPRIARDECIAAEGESFLNRVFRGAPSALLMHFCHQADLSDGDLEELQRFLAAKKSEKGSKQ